MRKIMTFILIALLLAALLPTAYAAAVPTVIATSLVSYNGGELQVRVVFNQPVDLQTDNSRVQFFNTSMSGGATYGGVAGGSESTFLCNSVLNGNTWYPDTNDKSVVMFKCWPNASKLPPTAARCYIGFSSWSGGITSISTGQAAAGLWEVKFTPPAAPMLLDVVIQNNDYISFTFDKPMIKPADIDVQFVKVVDNVTFMNTWSNISLSTDRKTISFRNNKLELNRMITADLRAYFDGTKEMRIRESTGKAIVFSAWDGSSYNAGADFYVNPVSERETTDYDASLSHISVSGHTLTQMRKANASTYLLNVNNNVSDITINAAPNQPGASVTGAGVHQLPNTDSFTTFEISVQSLNRKVTRKYYITVIKGTLPEAEVLSVACEIPAINKSANVIVTFNIPMACDYIKDIYLGPLPLGKIEAGSATRFSPDDPSLRTVIFNVNNHWGDYEFLSPQTGFIRLPAGDYTLLANDYNLKDALGRWVNAEIPFRSKSLNTSLSELSVTGHTITPVFTDDGIAYTLTVDSSISAIELVAEAADSYASVSGAGNKFLHPGENTFTVTVTAEDGTIMDYSLVITKTVLSGSNVITLAARENIPSHVCVTAENWSSTSEGIITITYDTNALILSDAVAATLQDDLTVGSVANSDIAILEQSAGRLVFSVDKSIPAGKMLSGILNIIRFTGQRNLTTEVVITIE